MGFSTRAIHAGESTDSTGAVVPPIYQVSTFRQAEPGVEGEYVYGRTGNPTRTVLESKLAALEEGRFGFGFASGMAAITTVVLSILKEGDHVLAVDDLYGGTRRFFERIMRNFGLEFSYVDGSKPGELESGFRTNTKMVWLETPTNPMLKIIDISSAAKLAHTRNAVVAVDNTFMSPYLQQPLKLGADLVVHSTTKYLGGHSDLIGGAAVTSDQVVADKIRFAQNAVGAVPGPIDCWLVTRGIRTLAVRLERHCSNALAIAKFLSKHRNVQNVIYPGLQTHPQYQLAKKQMRGFGGMVSLNLKGGSGECKRLLKNVKVFTVAESLGGVESLIEHPASMTHASVPEAERKRVGVTDSLIRLSIGIEDCEDLTTDLANALDHV